MSEYIKKWLKALDIQKSEFNSEKSKLQYESELRIKRLKKILKY